MAQNPEPGSMPVDPNNPANEPAKRVRSAARIPMSVPQLKLEVPDVPGYHLHWFLGQEIPRAIRGGYEYVDDEDVEIANFAIADDASNSGSTDMGSRISQFAGGLIEGTAEPQRLYLMKIKEELWSEDMAKLEERNEQIAAALRGGNQSQVHGAAPSETGADKLQRYLKTGQDLFIPKRR